MSVDQQEFLVDVNEVIKLDDACKLAEDLYKSIVARTESLEKQYYSKVALEKIQQSLKQPSSIATDYRYAVDRFKGSDEVKEA